MGTFFSTTRRIVQGLVIFTLSVTNLTAFAAAQSSSSNYRVDESAFSSGSNFDANSANYNAAGTAGLNAVGDASSTNFDVVAGLITPDVPFLEFVVTGGVVDLGVLHPNVTSNGAAQAGDCNCSFYVRSYVSTSYVVTTVSEPPRSSASGQILAPKTSQGPPSLSESVEEFGINLVQNTALGIGADPKNQPDDGFADGVAAAGYDTDGEFKYVVGDVIARSPGTPNTKAWGQTDYTISYIAKNSTLTPAGFYSMEHVMVATATY